MENNKMTYEEKVQYFAEEVQKLRDFIQNSDATTGDVIEHVDIQLDKLKWDAVNGAYVEPKVPLMVWADDLVSVYRDDVYEEESSSYYEEDSYYDEEEVEEDEEN